MSFYSSHKARILAGAYDTSLKASSAQIGNTVEMLEVTTLSDAAKRYIAGLTDATMQIDGYLDSDAIAQALTAFNTAQIFGAGVGVGVSYAPVGLAAGSPWFTVHALRSSFEAGSPVNGVTNFSLALQSEGAVGIGHSILDATAVTIDTNHASYDGGAASSTGAIAAAHVTAFSGLTNNVVTIEDSANNTDFTTIGTFSTFSGIGGSRITITGAVRRYVRAVSNVTGTGSCTLTVGFCRT